MKATIPNPCPAKWEDMRIGQLSRHCFQCKKDVIDFTQFSRDEILEFLLKHNQDGVCGRVNPRQLDFRHTQYYQVITALRARHNRSKLPLYLLVAASISIVACEPQSETQSVENHRVLRENSTAKDQQMRESAQLPETTGCGSLEEKEGQLSSLNFDSLRPLEVVTGMMVLPPEPDDWTETMGEVALYPDVQPVHFAEKMPEMKFGPEGLNDYLRQNLLYPESDRKRGVERTVWVSFVVDRTGQVIDVEIEGVIDGSRKMKREVLRVIEEMPLWSPGENQGEKVDVRMVIPVKFKLKSA